MPPPLCPLHEPGGVLAVPNRLCCAAATEPGMAER